MALVSFDEAYKTVMSSAFKTGTETIGFMDSLGRVLKGNIISDMDMPPFNKSTVDGFACRRADIEASLELIETIQAGTSPRRRISENQCSKIMTGAAMPAGADMVFMVEDSVILASGKVKFNGSFMKDNISPRGEDIRSGDRVLEKGRVIRPQDIALMALTGNTVSKGEQIACGICCKLRE